MYLLIVCFANYQRLADGPMPRGRLHWGAVTSKTKEKGEALEVAFNPAPARRRGFSLVHERVPHSGTVYLLLDHSASMTDRGKLGQLRRGALRFFGEAYLRGYAVGAVAFANRAVCLAAAGRNFYRFQQRLEGLEPDGRTAMAAAIRLATWRLRFARGRRVILLITDGQPNSRAAVLHAAAVARGRGIELIAVGTSGADEAFLASLTPKPELAHWVETSELEDGIASAARALPARGARR